MTLREMYEMIGNSDIPWDAEVEFVNGELKVVAPVRPLPPGPSDPDTVSSPGPEAAGGRIRTSRGIFG